MTMKKQIEITKTHNLSYPRGWLVVGPLGPAWRRQRRALSTRVPGNKQDPRSWGQPRDHATPARGHLVSPLTHAEFKIKVFLLSL